MHHQASPLEIWGGFECTVNRVNDIYLDQFEFSGHQSRIDDLDRVAQLGIRTLRYPLHWERFDESSGATVDWNWAQQRLTRMQSLGIRPILGLVHHGSGPRHTNLLEPSFGSRFANYAQRVAERFPWLEHFTPVNEPLTTARFSGLYGHWYPHGRSDHAFATALLNECRATVLAMQAIRRVVPNAQLVQTEDLGKAFSTPGVTYQADFENERRWLSWDLLCGRVDRQHPLHRYLLKAGIEEKELCWFLDNPCPPDILGINYYATSERFLDERLDHYPPNVHGGNGRHRYVDIEAVRVRSEGLAGVGVMVQEAWARYRLPIAITEVHLGCTREEQMRWLFEAWRTSLLQREQGIDLRALTVWSLLGAFDWNSLVTRVEGYYEPGVFDLRSPSPRPTGLARMIPDLVADRAPSHPVLDTPGWWRRGTRFLYPAHTSASVGPGRTFCASRAPETDTEVTGHPILVMGGGGRLGQAFERICVERGLAFRAFRRSEVDITDVRAVERVLTLHQPWAIVNAAGYVRVDEAESQRELCFRENVIGPSVLAEACSRLGISLLTFSSDFVFNGNERRAYFENDVIAPVNVYGMSKAEAEKCVLERFPKALVIRAGAYFSPWDEHNFAARVLRALRQGQLFSAADNTFFTPSYLPDLVHACLDLLIDGEQGIWHMTHRDAVSYADLARQTAIRAGLDADRITGRSAAALGFKAPRPSYSALDSERGILLPSLNDALGRYVRQASF